MEQHVDNIKQTWGGERLRLWSLSKRRLSWLKQDNFIILRYISTKLGIKVYILLFNSRLKISSKNLHALLKYQQKSLSTCTFYVHRVDDSLQVGHRLHELAY